MNVYTRTRRLDCTPSDFSAAKERHLLPLQITSRSPAVSSPASARLGRRILAQLRLWRVATGAVALLGVVLSKTLHPPEGTAALRARYLFRTLLASPVFVFAFFTLVLGAIQVELTQNVNLRQAAREMTRQ